MGVAESGSDHLAIYLNDHLGGSSLAIELVRRVSRQHEGTELGRFLSELGAEIEADRDTLRRAIERVGARPDPVKRAVGWTGEKLARLKLNGQLLSRSPLSTLIELETLTIGIHGKLLLWLALRATAGPNALDLDVDELIGRAERQEAAVEEHRLQAAHDAFAGQPA